MMANESPFVLTAGFAGGAAQVAVSGDLDVTTISTLDDMLSVALDRQPSRIVVDLGDVRYLDCAAARVIAQAAEALPGHRLIILNPVPMVRRLLELTDLAALIDDGQEPGPAATGPETVALTVAVEGHICVLTVTGDLDLASAGGFTVQAAQALAALDGRIERLVLDLGGLAFLDCAGARALARLAGAAPAGCPVIVRAVSPAAARLLHLTGLRLERPPGPGVAVHRDEHLTQQVQMTCARMVDMATSIRETAGHLASTGDRVSATFARLAEQRPHDADRLTELSIAAHEFADRSRRCAAGPR